MKVSEIISAQWLSSFSSRMPMTKERMKEISVQMDKLHEKFILNERAVMEDIGDNIPPKNSDFLNKMITGLEEYAKALSNPANFFSYIYGDLELNGEVEVAYAIFTTTQLWFSHRDQVKKNPVVRGMLQATQDRLKEKWEQAKSESIKY